MDHVGYVSEAAAAVRNAVLWLEPADITTARVLAVVQARGIAGVTGILGGEDFTYLRHNNEWLDNLEGKYRPCRNGVNGQYIAA